MQGGRKGSAPVLDAPPGGPPRCPGGAGRGRRDALPEGCATPGAPRPSGRAHAGWSLQATDDLSPILPALHRGGGSPRDKRGGFCPAAGSREEQGNGTKKKVMRFPLRLYLDHFGGRFVAGAGGISLGEDKQQHSEDRGINPHLPGTRMPPPQILILQESKHQNTRVSPRVPAAGRQRRLPETALHRKGAKRQRIRPYFEFPASSHRAPPPHPRRLCPVRRRFCLVKPVSLAEPGSFRRMLFGAYVSHIHSLPVYSSGR